MIVNFLGDLHCEPSSKFTVGTIQVGDLCTIDYKKFGGAERKFFIDGNHEYFPALDTNSSKLQEVARNLFYIPRGYRSRSTLFVGGSESIDKSQRIHGLDWFREESVTYAQIQRILDNPAKVETIVSHDCPRFLGQHSLGAPHDSTARLFDVLFQRLRPKLWIFGHHHRSIVRNYHDCHFRGLNINEAAQFDIEMDPL